MIEVNFAQTLRDQLELDLRKAITMEHTLFIGSARTTLQQAQKELKRTVRFEFVYKENMERAIELLNKGGFTTHIVESRQKKYAVDASY